MLETFTLSMSAIEALRIVRSYMRREPELSFEEASRIASKLEASAVDYVSAEALDLVMSLDGFEANEVMFYRSCIETVVLANPIWMKTMVLGRQKFVQKLDRDAASCFRCARLLDDPPSNEVVEWWDRLQ